MNKEYEVSTYQPGDEGGIVQLLELVFEGWPHLDLDCPPIDHWNWKFRDNPLKMSSITLAQSDDKIVGCHHTMPLRIKIGEEILPCTSGADFAVHPDFRGRRISRILSSQGFEINAEEGLKLHYAIIGNPILLKSVSQRRPRFPHPIGNLVRIRDIDRQLEAMPVENASLMKLGYGTAKFSNFIRNIFRSSGPAKHGLDIVRIDGFDDGINEFWDEASGHYNLIVERRREYLNWRYCDHRTGDFVASQAEENGRILGYSVLRINRYRQDYPVGFIVDLLTLPDRLDAADALAADAVQFFDDNDINIVNYQVVKGHPYEWVLKRHGFVDSRIKAYVFFMPLQEDDLIDKVKQIPASKVLISWGDHDVLPVTMPSYR